MRRRQETRISTSEAIEVLARVSALAMERSEAIRERDEARAEADGLRAQLEVAKGTYERGGPVRHEHPRYGVVTWDGEKVAEARREGQLTSDETAAKIPNVEGRLPRAVRDGGAIPLCGATTERDGETLVCHYVAGTGHIRHEWEDTPVDDALSRGFSAQQEAEGLSTDKVAEVRLTDGRRFFQYEDDVWMVAVGDPATRAGRIPLGTMRLNFLLMAGLDMASAQRVLRHAGLQSR